MVLGKHARVLREHLQEAHRIQRLEVKRNDARFGPRQKQQLLDDPVEPRELLELHLHSILVRRRQIPGYQELLRLQTHERQRRLELMGGFRCEAADLVERVLEAVEHLIEQPGELGYLIPHLPDGDALAEVVRADPVGGLTDEPHRLERQAA